MTKNYEYWRSSYITRTTDYVYKNLQAIDEHAESPIEKIAALEAVKFKDVIGEANCRIHLQRQIGSYKADIVVVGRDKKVAIECDGHEFHEKTKAQAARDKKRDRYFQTENFIVLRYTGSEIVNDPSVILNDLIKIFEINTEWPRE